MLPGARALASSAMAPNDRELIHKVNNLIAVVYTQVAVGKATGTFEDAAEALDIIERAAQETAEVAKRAQREMRQAGHQDG